MGVSAARSACRFSRIDRDCKVGRVVVRLLGWAGDPLIGPKLKWHPRESRGAIVSHIVSQTGDYKQAGRYAGHASEKTTYRYRILRAPERVPAVWFSKRA